MMLIIMNYIIVGFCQTPLLTIKANITYACEFVTLYVAAYNAYVLSN